MDLTEAARLPAGDQTVWADASGFLSAVCSELQVGELIHGENFSLFEAMSALEIMDPKMDAGMTAAGFKTAEKAIESGAAPIDLSIPQLIDVMDNLLACEATWHKGDSLAQTIFSCLYMLKMDRTVPNALLHAYCRITQATCNIVRSAVALADIHEEEDMFTVSFGFPLEGDGSSKCLSTLNAVEEAVARNLRGSKGASSKKKPSEDIEPLQSDPDLEEGFCRAILCRLRFRKALYHALVYMDKPQGRGLEMSRKHIATAVSELEAIRATSQFLSSAPRRSAEHVNGSVEQHVSTASGHPAIGFDESVNRRLLAPTPPRAIKTLTWNEALKYFEQMLNDLDRICSVPFDLGLEELLQFVVDFQKSRPDLVARARLQLLLLQDEKIQGREPVMDIVRKAMNLPVLGVSDNHALKDTFEGQVGRLTVHLLKILCTNPAWQRRKLGRVINEWAGLLQQAEFTRQSGHRGDRFGGGYDKSWWTENVSMGWAAEQICWIVGHYLMLGFELELYAPCEYAMVYWYLDHVLLTLFHYKLAKEKTSIEQDQSKSLENADSLKKKGKKKKGAAKGVGREIRLTTNVLLLQCYIDLCKGSVRMMAALTRDRKVVQRTTIFNSEQERFVQRFELLQTILVPEPMTYYHFKDATRHQNFHTKELYQVAYEHFVTVQQHLQELSQAASKAPELSTTSRTQRALEIKKMEQVAMRNRIALQIAHQAGPGDNLRVSFDFSHHPCFAVAVVKKS